MARSVMSASEKFVFDLHGFIVLRGVLSREEITRANAAVDRFQSELHERKGAAHPPPFSEA